MFQQLVAIFINKLFEIDLETNVTKLLSLTFVSKTCSKSANIKLRVISQTRLILVRFRGQLLFCCLRIRVSRSGKCIGTIICHRKFLGSQKIFQVHVNGLFQGEANFDKKNEFAHLDLVRKKFFHP